MTLSPALKSNLTKACKALIQAQGKIHADLFDPIDPAAPDSLQQLSVRRDLLTARLVDLQSAIDNVTFRRNAFFDSASSTQDQDEDQAAIDAYLREARIDETLVEARSALSTVQSQLDIVNRLTANIRTSDSLANPTQPGNVEEPSNRSVAPNSDTGTATQSFAPTSTTAYNYPSPSYGIAPAPPNNISAPQVQVPYNSQVYLDRLTLEPFYGDVTQFHKFWCAFELAVHNDPNMSPIHKFLYLQSLLKGEAQIVLQDLDPERPNYYQLVSLLRKRYDCPHKIRAMLHKQLQQLSPSRGSGSDLRNTWFRISGILHGLRKYEDFRTVLPLLDLVRGKFPVEIRQKLHDLEFQSGSEFDLDQVMQKLDIIISSRERYENSLTLGESMNINVSTRKRSPSRSLNIACFSSLQTRSSSGCASQLGQST
ncbi:unnamed protein product [Nippostrongylus brasiliensis]|uniref:Uncharacterized protein n=1 Tax=Nippostrongylus brasiliensis TaxID=27835 RepID=A0A0N4YAT4_NIPBR|nr:unnamed protein product [Nippostrongylus brasiliensis]